MRSNPSKTMKQNKKVQPIQPMAQKKEKPWPRPAIGIPLERAISHADKVFFPFLAIAQQGFPIIAISYGRTDLIRNKMALHTLNSDVTHVVLLDLHRKHPPQIVQNMMNTFIRDEDARVVIGTGGNLAVDRRVFEELEPPWFSFDTDYDNKLDWSRCVELFLERCRKEKVKIIFDANIISPIPTNEKQGEFIIHNGNFFPINEDYSSIDFSQINTKLPIVGIPLERAISHADKVFFPFLAIAQQGFPFIAANFDENVAKTREKFLKYTKLCGASNLIMLDLDHVHPWDIVQRFMQHFIRDPELRIVAGLNFRRGEPYDPCAYVRGDSGKYHPMAEWEKGLVKVDVAGTGSIAIDRRVFEEIEPPWFAYDYSKVLEDNWPGEDFYFCDRCREAGIPIYVDTTLNSPHLIDAVVDERTFHEFRIEKGMGVVPIGDVVSSMKDQEKGDEGNRN